MIKFTLFLFLVSINIVFSQYVPEWVQVQSQTNLNIDNSKLSAIDASGNIYVVNYWSNSGNSDITLTKFNNSGVFEWQKQYNSATAENLDYPRKIFIEQSGNIIILCNANNDTYTDGKLYLLRYSPSGTLLNSVDFKRPGNDVSIGIDIAGDNSGNLFIAGQAADNQLIKDSALIIKFNQSLNFQWSKTYNDTNVWGNYFNNIKTDPSGFLFVTGYAVNKIINIKYDNSGNIIWTGKFYSEFPPYTNHLSPASYLDNSQNLYVSDAKYEVSGNDTSKTLLLKYNTSGALQWSFNYNISSTGIEAPRRIFSDNNNNIYLDVNYYNDSYLLKVNSSGQQQWVKAMDHYVYSMNLDNSNNIITAGYKNSYNRKDMCMEKFSPSGTLDASFTFSYNGAGFDQATTFFNTSDSKIILGGYHNSSVMFVKLTPSFQQVFTSQRTSLFKPIIDSQVTYDTVSVPADRVPPFSQIKKVYVNLDTILHTAVGDLYLMLEHEGKTDTLLYQRGGSLDNLIGTKFADSSASPICGSGFPPYTGYFRPCFPLNQFNILSASGPWILKIFDRRSPDTGMLKAWSISVVYEIPIGISPVSQEIPEHYNLSQNYPNPFNPVTKIRYSIPESSDVNLSIYDISGRIINIPVHEYQAAGVYEVSFDASNLASGVYFYILETAGFTETKKMVLIK